LAIINIYFNNSLKIIYVSMQEFNNFL